MPPSGGLEEIVEFDYDTELEELKTLLSDIKVETPTPPKLSITDIASVIGPAVGVAGLGYFLTFQFPALRAEGRLTSKHEYLHPFLIITGSLGALCSALYKQNRQINKNGISSWPINLVTAAVTLISYFLWKNYGIQKVPPGFFIKDNVIVQDMAIIFSAFTGVVTYCATTLFRAAFHPTTLKTFYHTRAADFWRNWNKPERMLQHWQKIIEIPTAREMVNRMELGDLYLSQGLITEAIDEYNQAMNLATQPMESKIPLDIFKYVKMGYTKKLVKGKNGDKVRDAIISFREGKLSDATESFTEAIKVDKMNPLIHIAYARFLSHCNLEDYALREENFALTLLPPIEKIGERVKGTRNIVHKFEVRYD